MSVLKGPWPEPAPPRTRTCDACTHGYLGVYGVYCVEYQEHIDDEIGAAAECELWEPA